MKQCKICGDFYEDWEMTGSICDNCASSMLQQDGIDLGLGGGFD